MTAKKAKRQPLIPGFVRALERRRQQDTRSAYKAAFDYSLRKMIAEIRREK